MIPPIMSRQSLAPNGDRSEEHTSELQSHLNLVCRLLLEKKKKTTNTHNHFDGACPDRTHRTYASGSTALAHKSGRDHTVVVVVTFYAKDPHVDARSRGSH